MRLALKDVVDPIGSPKISHQAVRSSAGRTGITTLVEAHMGMILQIEAETLLQEGGEGLSDTAGITRFEAMHKA